MRFFFIYFHEKKSLFNRNPHSFITWQRCFHSEIPRERDANFMSAKVVACLTRQQNLKITDIPKAIYAHLIRFFFMQNEPKLLVSVMWKKNASILNYKIPTEFNTLKSHIVWGMYVFFLCISRISYPKSFHFYFSFLQKIIYFFIK